MRPCSFLRMGAKVACDVVLRRGLRGPGCEFGQRLDQQVRAGFGQARGKSGAVSSGPIGVSHCSSMSPVSSPASMRMVVTPVCVVAAGNRPLDRRGAA